MGSVPNGDWGVSLDSVFFVRCPHGAFLPAFFLLFSFSNLFSSEHPFVTSTTCLSDLTHLIVQFPFRLAHRFTIVWKSDIITITIREMEVTND